MEHKSNQLILANAPNRVRTHISLIILLCLCNLFATANANQQSAVEQITVLENASMAVTDLEGKSIFGTHQNKPLIPASTTKLITAWLALKHWGETHRFSTDFYLDKQTATLWIKAGGDPFLVSEELQLIAQKIALLDPGKIDQIALDVSLFKSDLVVPGAGVTNNPYDAIPTAIACNFNTVNLKKVGNSLQSAEPQTPLTEFSRSFANAIAGKTLRVNTGQKSKDSERYFAELLAQILRNLDVEVGTEVIWGSFPAVKPDLIHQNSRTLGEIIELMLKYSTNFIANQLILTLVAEFYKQPADFQLVKQYMNATLTEQFNWNNAQFIEGAGLSTDNKVSTRQLTELMRDFEPWMHLLPEVAPGVFAKTGTLTGVSSLAGFLIQANKLAKPFAIIVNESMSRDQVVQAAIELANTHY